MGVNSTYSFEMLCGLNSNAISWAKVPPAVVRLSLKIPRPGASPVNLLELPVPLKLRKVMAPPELIRASMKMLAPPLGSMFLT